MFGRKAHVMRTLKDSTDPAAIRAALRECRDEGWLTDGSLHKVELEGADLQGFDLSRADFTRGALAGANLRGADLRRAILVEADLTGCDLTRADLRRADLRSTALAGANLRDAQIHLPQLTEAESLADATMPDGSRYDGRFRLLGDWYAGREDGVYPDEPERMAEWYGVSEAQYEAGQEWAEENLEEMQKMAALMSQKDQVWVDEMRESGKLTDGSLRGEDLSAMELVGADLRGARLEECSLQGSDLVLADLEGADLRGASLVAASLAKANLRGVNLEGAFLDGADLTQTDLTGAVVSDDQLAQASGLLGATLSDGSLYDGRYNLEGDLFDAEDIGIDLDDPEQMADWYGVPRAVYESGQRWAEKNLARLRPDEEYGE